MCGNGAIENGESCDTAIAAGATGACPEVAADCDDGLACTIDEVTGSGCTTECAYTEITDVGAEDGCCPAGATTGEDSDCAAQCGNAQVDPGETCDTGIPAGVGRCVTAIDCDDANACTDDGVLSEGTCQAVCFNQPTSMLEDGDECCPISGNANTDSDCAPVCGNGTLEVGEECDIAIPSNIAGACPIECDDGLACTVDILSGSGCAAHCSYQPITTPLSDDGCCPAGGDANNDNDCAAVCGNDVYEPGGNETCDIGIETGAGACPGGPSDCADGNACTNDTASGVGCLAACSNSVVTVCASGDGCCPSGSCNNNTDSDCDSLCGNAALEAGERCDTGVATGAGACPSQTGCSDGIACTRDVVTAEGCEQECAHQVISAPVDGDGCCAADYNTDSDCASQCGNGILEPDAGENCDINGSGAADCPSSCSDGNACTVDTMTGSGCAVDCSYSAISACSNGDGCCPSGCAFVNDNDCSTLCGNATVESDETCDTAISSGAGSCPTAASCDDGSPATRDALESGGTCRARCVHTPITECAGGDGYCPSGCNANTDADCVVTCGNGVVEGTESCDSGITTGAGACPTSCSDGAACTTDTLVGTGCARTCSYAAVSACADGDGCCPSGCDGSSDSDCDPQCGNGAIETGETCDIGLAGSCPASCDDGDVSTDDSLENAGTCDARCVATPITTCRSGDNYCPGGCNSNVDPDCTAECGNGAVEAGEACDTAIPGSCPTDCGTAPTCTTVQLVDPGTCTATCVYTDNPPPCCGNGDVDETERCDTAIAPGMPGACPSSCNDFDACTVDTLYGAGCQLACANVFDVPDCPAPTGSNHYSQCGRVYDIATGTPLDDGRPETGTPYRNVEVRIYDPIQFAADPDNTAPIDTVYPNSCGWFEGFNLPRPLSGFSAPGLDDCEDPELSGDPVTVCDEPAVDHYIPTGASAVVEPGENERHMNIFFTTHETDELWSEQLGLTNETITDKGVYFPIVLDSSREGRLAEWVGPFEGRPVSGVRITVSASGGPYDDYYFADTDPLYREVIGLALTTTGLNGAGIITTLTTSVFTAGGTGNERTNPSLPAGMQTCQWTSHPAAAIPGVVFVQERWPVCCTADTHCEANEICAASNCYRNCEIGTTNMPDQSVCDALEIELYDGRPDRPLKCLDDTKPTGRFSCRRP